MNKNDLKYDPELPYVVVEPAPGGIKVCGRFVLESDARHFLTEILGPGGDVIDTTPKPKIPADAQYITWVNQADNGEALIAFKYGHPDNKVWRVGWSFYDEKDMIAELIGDSEVVVLVPKEDA